MVLPVSAPWTKSGELCITLRKCPKTGLSELWRAKRYSYWAGEPRPLLKKWVLGPIFSGPKIQKQHHYNICGRIVESQVYGLIGLILVWSNGHS